MAIKKPLVLGADGSIEQLQSGDTLDITMPSAGDTIVVTLAENVATGDFVAATASGVVKADKDDPTKVRVIGVSTETASSGATANIRIFNQVGGLSGLTAGSPVFLDVAGAVRTSPPTAGHAVRLGVALSSTDLLLEIAQPIRL